MAHLLGVSAELAEGGPALLFRVIRDERIYPAFAIRFGHRPIGYLNVCAHAGLRLNGVENDLFSRDGNSLYCRSHGAFFDPESGQCTHGPCQGLGLIPLEVSESEGRLYLTDEAYTAYE